MSYKGYKGIGPKKYGCNKSTNPESPAKFWGALASSLLGGGGAAAGGGGAMGMIGKLGGMMGGGGGGGSKSAPEPKDDE